MSRRGKQSVAPGKDWSTAMKQGMCSEIVLSGRTLTLLTEGMGNHWRLLDQEARTKFQEILEEHNFAHRVIARHMRQLPSMPSMGNQDVIIFLIRRFLDQTRGQATVEDAAVYLARSSWDVRLASYRWIDPENYAAMAEDELWGDEKNDEAYRLNIDEVSIVFHTSLEAHLTHALDGSTCRPKSPNSSARDPVSGRGRDIRYYSQCKNTQHCSLRQDCTNRRDYGLTKYYSIDCQYGA